MKNRLFISCLLIVAQFFPVKAQYQRYTLGQLDCDNLYYTDSGFTPVEGFTGKNRDIWDVIYNIYNDGTGKPVFSFYDTIFRNRKGVEQGNLKLVGSQTEFSGSWVLPFPDNRFRIIQSFSGAGWEKGIPLGLYSTRIAVQKDSIKVFDSNRFIHTSYGDPNSYAGLDSANPQFHRIVRANDTVYLGFYRNMLFKITWDTVYISDSLSFKSLNEPPLFRTVLNAFPGNICSSGHGVALANEAGTFVLYNHKYEVYRKTVRPPVGGIIFYEKIYDFLETVVYSVNLSTGKFNKLERIVSTTEQFPYSLSADTLIPLYMYLSDNGDNVIARKWNRTTRQNNVFINKYQVTDRLGQTKNLGSFAAVYPYSKEEIYSEDVEFNPFGHFCRTGPEGSLIVGHVFRYKSSGIKDAWLQFFKIRNVNGNISNIYLDTFGKLINRPVQNLNFKKYNPYLYSYGSNINIRNYLDFNIKVKYGCSASAFFLNLTDTSYRKFRFTAYISKDTLGKSWMKLKDVKDSFIFLENGSYPLKILGESADGYREWWQSEIQIQFPKDSISHLLSQKPELILATWIDDDHVRISWQPQPRVEKYHLYRFNELIGSTKDSLFVDMVGAETYTKSLIYNVVSDYGCNRKSLKSDPHETIYLQGSTNDSGNTNRIFWTEYKGWDVSPVSYSLIRKSVQSGIRDSVVIPFMFGNDYMLNNPIVKKYYVYGHSNNGAQARSNSVVIIPQLKLYYPSAISVNSDRLNDCFEIITNYQQQGSYSVYTRWGERIFTGSLLEKWCPDRNLPSGVYVVKISAGAFSTAGTVTFLK